MTAKSIRIDPVIMWEPNSGKQITVRTNTQYDRALAKGYVWLMDADESEEVARMSADFIVGRYYVLETRVCDGLIRFLGNALRDGTITQDDLMRLQSAKVIKRTRCTVTFYIPLLGQEVRARVKRANIECQDNEVARIPQMNTEGGVYKGRTDYPSMTIYAYDSLGNNDRMNEEMQGVYL